MKVALVTAIYGGFDELRSVKQTSELDCFCFTDDPSLDVEGWDIRHVPGSSLGPRMDAKRFKVLSQHHVGPEYDVVVWMDGCYEVFDPEYVVRDLAPLARNHGLVLHRHAFVEDVMAEARKALAYGRKYEGLRLAEQARSYIAEGFFQKDHYACGVFARRHRDARVEAAERLWWSEILRWGPEDQISLPYVLWHSGIKPLVLNTDVLAPGWARWLGHTHDDA